MNINSTFLLRVAVSITLFMHSVPGMFNGGVNNFGQFYLNEAGFAPLGVPLAWAIKLSHVAAIFCLMFEKYVKLASLVTIFILVAGIVMVHYPEGWFVVGGGRNGMEFNVLLIFVLLAIMFPNGLKKSLR
jgi:putative oxidoreductase